jgi:phosphoribosyl-ATP pyrophosphohydrolase/phosphoribosyl-AMP cyclohydrolase
VTVSSPGELTYDERGLLPVVVQDAGSGLVLMLAYANVEAIERTLSSRTTWFWSRSRNEFWNKGATSGNTQAVLDVRYDCDGDAVLYLVEPAGPACHTGETTCFHRSLATQDG